MEKWTRIAHQPCLPMGKDGRLVTACEEHIRLSRQAATEGMVLLKTNAACCRLRRAAESLFSEKRRLIMSGEAAEAGKLRPPIPVIFMRA